MARAADLETTGIGRRLRRRARRLRRAAIAWPLRPGRDLDEYLYAWIQLFDHDVLLPWSMLFRTPVTPVVAGGALDAFGGALAEPMCAVFFALSVVAWTAAALTFGPRVALLTAAALLVYPGYAAMFHELGERDDVRGRLRALGLLVVRAGRFTTRTVGSRRARRPRDCVLALIRPQRGHACVRRAFPLLVVGTWRNRVRWAAADRRSQPSSRVDACTTECASTRGRSRGAATRSIPFYRAFITDHIVGTENGEASRELARGDAATPADPRSVPVVRRHTDELFRRGSFRVHEDLYILSDQVFGWDSDYRVLRDAGVEGVRAHPGTYASGVLGTVWNELAKAQFRPEGIERRTGNRGGSGNPERPSHADHGGAHPVRTGGLDLASGSKHPPGVDLRHGLALRVRPPRTARPLPRDRGEGGRLLRVAADPCRERAARAPPRPTLSLVSAALDVDRRRSRRHRVPTTARSGDARRPRAGGRRRRRPERPGALHRPSLRAARGAGLRTCSALPVGSARAPARVPSASGARRSPPVRRHDKRERQRRVLPVGEPSAQEARRSRARIPGGRCRSDSASC